MKISEKEIFLFDIDNTILDFDMAEKYGISNVFEFLGFKYTENDLQEYSKYNQSLWKKIEQGEITRDQLFERYGLDTEGLYNRAVDFINKNKWYIERYNNGW